MVKAKPHNKTEDLILKIKEVMVSLDSDTVAKANTRYTSRTEAVVTADGYFNSGFIAATLYIIYIR
jgi:hypothetical protein